MLVVSGWQAHQKSKLRQAADKFWAARNVQDLEIISEDFSRTPYAPLAMLASAKEYFNLGKYSQALKKYSDFQIQNPTHHMVDVARVGELHCREAMGQAAEACEGFKAFVARNADHYLMPQALLGEARCLEVLSRPQESKALYEEFISTHTNSRWMPKMKENLKLLTRRMEKPAVTAAVPMPAAAATSVALPIPAPTNVTPSAMIDLSGFQTK